MTVSASDYNIIKMQSLSHFAGDLTLLYTETKNKALSSISKTESAPELSHLDRKLRIQKDRLITWGLEWTDQSDKDKESQGDIDVSVARAGVTETVTSVLGNIKDVLEQAEKVKTSATTWSAPEKGPLTTFNVAIYQDILKDLESSVDILYEISRSRRALATGSHPTFSSDQYSPEYAPGTIVLGSSHSTISKDQYSDEHQFGKQEHSSKAPYLMPSFASSQTTLVNPLPFARPNLSPYAGLPASISPQALRLPAEAPPPYETFGVPSATRMIGRLIISKVPESIRAVLRSNSSDAHVLVEYANFDSLYHETGVPPPLQRLEGLAVALQHVQARKQPSLILLGYFEDPNQPRIGLVYDFLSTIHGGVAALDLDLEQLVPVSLLNLVQTANKGAKPADILSATPFLEDRFRVALRIAGNLKSLHTEGYSHGNLNSGSIIFFRHGQNPHLRRGELHRPTLSSFDMFSRTKIERSNTASHTDITKHPADHGSNLDSVKAIQFDLYGLALLLLEIGLWTPLHDLYKPKYSLRDFKLRIEKIWVPRLASKCGSLYMRAVQACLRLSDEPDIDKMDIDQNYEGIIRRLQRCCFLDEDEPIIATSEWTSYSRQPASASSQAQELNMRGPVASIKPNPAQSMSYDKSGGPPSLAPHSKLHTVVVPDKADAGNLNPGPVHGIRRSIVSKVNSENVTDSRDIPIMRRSKRALTTSPFHEYRQKVVLIQTCWRQRCLRKAATDGARTLVSVNPLGAIGSNQLRGSEGQYGSGDSQSRRVEPHGRRSCESISRRGQIYPVKLPQPALDIWHTSLGLRISRIVERALKDSTESSSIDLVGLGHDPFTARPTILVTCASTARVKAALKRKFDYDRSVFDLKVRKGRVSLAKGKASRRERSAKRASGADSDDGERYFP